MAEPDYTAARIPRPPRRFTVMLPVVRPPGMLPFAIRSVLAQSETDFELVIVCDGAPEETLTCAMGFAQDDPRIHVFPFPKGQRHGEAHRAAVLDGARSEFVTHIGDDDLWFPDYLEVMGDVLSNADFASICQFNVLPEGRFAIADFGDLSLARTRRKLLEGKWNYFGPTEAGYRLDAYRQLAEGWAPGPEDLYSDLNMWRKFLRHPGLRFRSRHEAAALKFPTPGWAHLPDADRSEAIARHAVTLSDPETLRAHRSQARRLLARRIKRRRLLGLLLRDPATYWSLARSRFRRPVRHPK